ncbi:MAG: hypothetical protein ACE5JI_15080 [Acidobacteriota bacterium]
MYVGAVGKLDPTFAADPEELERVRKFLASGDDEAAGRAPPSATLRRFRCFGTPDDVVRRTNELFDAGVDLFELGAPHGVDQAEAIRPLGEKVLPAFGDS